MNYSSVIKVPDEKALDALCGKMFSQLLMHPNVILRIRDIDYKLPTAIQAGALPLALSGKDIIVQSPPESGKTLVFAALAAHIVSDNHQSQQREPFVTIFAASSEHVTKIKNLIVKLVPDSNTVCAFYGDGDDFTDEKIAKGCSVVIGTPDRLAKLCADGGITIKLSKLLIIDDADKLMAPTFAENIQSIFKYRGSVVQVAAFCSSYPDGIEGFLQQFMESPSILRIDRQDFQLSTTNRDDKVALEDNKPEIDDGISQSEHVSKNVSSNEPSTSPTKTLPVSSRNANVDEPSMASQSAAVQLSTANRDDKVSVKDCTPETVADIAVLQSEQLSKNVSSDEATTKTSSGDHQDVHLNAANRDDKVAIEDKTPDIDHDVKDNKPEKATSQSDQLSKNVSSNEPSASPSKTSPGGSFEHANGFGAQNNGADHGFGSACGGSRGGLGQSSGFGTQNNDSGFGSTRGGRSGFVQSNGLGSQNNDSGFGSTRGGRGGFGQSNGLGSQNNDSGFGSTRGGRSGFGAQNNDSGFGSTHGGRGGFGQSNGFGAQNIDSGFGSTRSGSRGGFGPSSGFGAQNNDSGFGSTRGGRSGFGVQNNDGGQSFGNTRGGSRGGFGGGGSRSGYNRSTEFGGDNQMSSYRGSFGRGGGGFSQINNSDDQMNPSREGFGRASRGSYGRGGCGQPNVYNQQDSNGFGENQMNSSGSNRNRGGFGNLNSAENQMSLSGVTRGGFGGGRGGFGTSNSAQDHMNSSGSNRGFPSRGGFGTSNSAENQINSPVLNRGGSFHSNSDGRSSHGGFGSVFGHPAADNSQDAPASEDKPQPLVLGHRFVR